MKMKATIYRADGTVEEIGVFVFVKDALDGDPAWVPEEQVKVPHLGPDDHLAFDWIEDGVTADTIEQSFAALRASCEATGGVTC